MSGKLTIDGIDIAAEYGVLLVEGSYRELLQFPAMKSPDANEWAEEDGVEAELSDPVMDAKTLSINLAATDQVGLGLLLNVLTTETYHELTFTEIGLTKSLRMINQSNYRKVREYSELTLEFAEDQPMDGYTYLAPSSTMPAGRFEIDEVNIAAYGLYFLQGTMAEIYKTPATKQNLTINLAATKGVTYDGENTRMQQKEVTIQCLMKAASAAAFLRNFNALLYDLTRPYERQMYVLDTEDTVPFYYRSSRIEELICSEGIWCRFSITVVVSNLRFWEWEKVLANEDGIIIVTEEENNEGELSAINLIY